MSIRQQLLNHIEELGYCFDNPKVKMLLSKEDEFQTYVEEIELGYTSLDDMKRFLPKLISWQEAA